MRLHGNPLADPRIRRFVENDEPSLVKDLLNHVKKNGYKGDGGGGGGGGKGKGKKGKKGKAAKEEEPEDEEDTDANIADLLAAMGGGSGSDED